MNTRQCILNLPIDYYFACADFTADDISYSDTTATRNHVGDEVPEELLPPESPPTCAPEITFASTSPML